MIKNIFGTAEASAWSRDFDHVDYQHLCEAYGVKPVPEPVYAKLCEAFNLHMDLSNMAVAEAMAEEKPSGAALRGADYASVYTDEQGNPY